VSRGASLEALLWSLAAGTALGVAVEPPGILLLVVSIPLLAARRRRSAAVFGLLLFGCGAGALAATRAADPGMVAEAARAVPICDFEGSVLEHAGALGTMISIEALKCSSFGARGAIGDVVVDGRVGDPGGKISGEGRLVPLGNDGFSTGRRRLGAGAELDLIRASTYQPRARLLRLAGTLRRGVVAASDSLPRERAALLAGLTIGDTSNMDPGTEEDLRRAGLSHLVAVSGSNVAIVVGAVLLGVLRLGRIAGLAAASVALVVYVLAVGPEPSVLRAGAMGAIALVALATGRRAEPLAALALAVTLVLLVKPGIVSSVGLHLSVAATGGLILWSEPIAARIGLPRPVALATGATVAAQLAVAPLLIGVFGQISVVGPMANLLALPAVPVATVLGMLSGCVAAVNEVSGRLLARLAEPAVAWILFVGHAFGGHPWASATISPWIGAPLGLLLLPVAARAAARRKEPRNLWS
jgi:competence protein ComEC